MTWLCESLRLTALWDTIEVPATAANLHWQSVVGTEPETREVQPKKGIETETGLFEIAGATLQRGIAPGRIDWVLTPIAQDDVSLTEIPNFGDVDAAYGHFKKLLFEKIATTYDAPRFALGVSAFLVAVDKKDSYAQIMEILKSSNFDCADASDFIFQINRPRKPKTPIVEQVINRLARWQSVRMTPVRFISMPVFVGKLSDEALANSMSATRVVLDINNSGKPGEIILAKDRNSLLSEFGDLALEILRKGDIP